MAISPTPNSCSSFVVLMNAYTSFENSHWLHNQIYFIELTIFHENEYGYLSIDLIKLISCDIKVGACDRIINYSKSWTINIF